MKMDIEHMQPGGGTMSAIKCEPSLSDGDQDANNSGNEYSVSEDVVTNGDAIGKATANDIPDASADTGSRSGRAGDEPDAVETSSVIVNGSSSVSAFIGNTAAASSGVTGASASSAGFSTGLNGINSSIGLSILSQMSDSSKVALNNLAYREKRCRVFEREANELKDVICSMNHMVHILENIKRVSRDYIHYLYELIGSTFRQENQQVEQLYQEIMELEAELKQWERKYHVMSSFNASNNGAQLSTLNSGLFSGASGCGTGIGGSSSLNPSNNNNHNSSVASSEQCPDDNILEGDNVDSTDGMELLEQCRRSQLGANSGAGGNSHNTSGSNGNLMLIPPELCEMSMETHEGDSMVLENGTENSQQSSHQARAAAAAAAAAAAIIMNPSGHSASAASSPLIAAALAAATAATASGNVHKKLGFVSKSKSSSQGVSNNGLVSHNSKHGNNNSQNNSPHYSSTAAYSSSSKPLFQCDHQGCDYQTNMRQRLAMHKRMHAGEMLYSCDIPGCGYQSNYKGNIKIHKKHRHRIESSGEQSSANTPTAKNAFAAYGDLNNSQTPNSATKMRTRGRKRKSHPSSFTNNNNSINIVPSLRQFELKDPGEEGQNSSCEMYSGNESGNKEPDLYECDVDGCSYRSKWKQCWTAHKFLHDGVKPYKCDFPGCNYSTNFKGNVNVHKRVHRASEYQCKFEGCNFSTPWKNSFSIHQRNHVPSIGPDGAIESVGLVPSQPSQQLTDSNDAVSNAATNNTTIGSSSHQRRISSRDASNRSSVFGSMSSNLSPISLSLDGSTGANGTASSPDRHLGQLSNRISSHSVVANVLDCSRVGGDVTISLQPQSAPRKLTDVDDDEEEIDDDEDEEEEIDEEEEMSVMSFTGISATGANSNDQNSNNSYNSLINSNAAAVPIDHSSRNSIQSHVLSQLSGEDFSEFDHVM